MPIKTEKETLDRLARAAGLPPDDRGVFYHPETGEVLNGLRQSILSLDGRLEYPDPVPMAPPVNLPDRARGMRELVQELLLS